MSFYVIMEKYGKIKESQPVFPTAELHLIVLIVWLLMLIRPLSQLSTVTKQISLLGSKVRSNILLLCGALFFSGGNIPV